MPNESGRGVDAALPDHIAGLSTGHPRTASVCQWLTDMLAALGSTMAFGVLDGPIAPLVDAFSMSALRVIHTRHESGAVFCAMEASLVLRAPQVAFVTTGPGLYNALNGTAAAQRSKTSCALRVLPFSTWSSIQLGHRHSSNESVLCRLRA